MGAESVLQYIMLIKDCTMKPSNRGLTGFSVIEKSRHKKLLVSRALQLKQCKLSEVCIYFHS